MQTLPTNEFLAKKLGLVRGNPFSDSQAEDEDQLSKYFVDLPAFYGILDMETGKPKSAILSAGWGCGKSANRRNVERWLQFGPKQGYKGKWPWESPILVARYLNFNRLKTRVGGDFSRTKPEDHVNSILWTCVSSLLEYLEENWDKIKAWEKSDWIISQFGYYLVNYTMSWAHQNKTQEEVLSQRTSKTHTINSFLGVACNLAPKAELLAYGGTTSLIEGFKEVAYAFGIKNIVVLVDKVDEFESTANNPKLGAILLRSLIAEQTLMQMDGLYFKFFLPDKVVLELKKFPETRLGERLRIFDMNWEEDSIQSLLSERLKAFSNGKFQDLGQIAASELTDVGRTLAVHASNNPRNLLRLCNWIMIHLEQNTSKSQKARITKEIIDLAVKSFREDSMNTSAYSAVISHDQTSANFIAYGWEITADMRTVIHNGKIISSEKLDNIEYKILIYLIQNAGKPIEKEEIKTAVWGAGEGVSDSALTQPIYRLRKKIGKERIETLTGRGVIFHSD